MPTPARQLLWEHTLPLGIDTNIQEALARVELPFLREVLAEASEGGKRVRPILTALACAAAGGDERATLRAGSALELLHASSLVHDDIMDNADLRRGQPTVVRRYGTPVAILAGDALMALAFRLIQSVDSPRKEQIVALFTSTFLDLCEGQCADVRSTATLTDNVGSHRWMVERKTARLLEACTTIGALLATDDPAIVTPLRTFGLSLGLAYQATDDLLDLVGDEEEVGKTLGVDRRNGRSTFLTLAYPEADPVEQIRQAVVRYTNDATGALAQLPGSPARDRLHQLALSLLDRRR